MKLVDDYVVEGSRREPIQVFYASKCLDRSEDQVFRTFPLRSNHPSNGRIRPDVSKIIYRLIQYL